MKRARFTTQMLSIGIVAAMLGACSASQVPDGLQSPIVSSAVRPNTVTHHLYVTSPGGYAIAAYTISVSDGSLTPVHGSPLHTPFLPFAIANDPNGPFLYANLSGISRKHNGYVTGYAVDSKTGALTAVGHGQVAGKADSAVAINPAGTFVYVASEGSDRVFASAIDASTGALTKVPGSPFAAGSASGVAIDPTGKFAYVSSYNKHLVSGFSIDSSSGALKPVKGSPFSTGGSPSAVAISGSFVYVANLSSNNVSAYVINPDSGALTQVQGSPFAAGSGPYEVATDPAGGFVYVTNVGSNNVSAYTIDTSSGALTPVSGSPFTAGASPRAVAIDPTGRYVYVVNSGNYRTDVQSISGYAVNAATGALTQVPGSPMTSNGARGGLVVR